MQYARKKIIAYFQNAKKLVTQVKKKYNIQNKNLLLKERENKKI